MKKRTFFLAFLLSLSSACLFAQPGAWLMYFGSNKITDRFQIHTDIQLRNREIVGNTDQLLLRTGLKTKLTTNLTSIVGYALINYYPATDPKLPSLQNEHRLWQELNTKQRIGRMNIEHRYRAEERFFSLQSSWKWRFRYRVYLALPLNNKEMDPGTFFLSTYDEIFINRLAPQFSQNRLYFAAGYVLNKDLSFQAGYLFQQFTGRVPEFLQLALFFNPRLQGKNN